MFGINMMRKGDVWPECHAKNIMFITMVLEYIWRSVSDEYKSKMLEADQLSNEEIENSIIDKFNVHENGPISEWLNMTSLFTSGCPHKINKGNFSGCSMCNYFKEDLESLVLINLLKERDPVRYGNVIKYSFDLLRGKKKMPNLFEYVNGHDSLSPEELPDPVFQQIFLKEQLFSSKPYRLILETRANNVSAARIRECKKKSAKTIEIAFGVEVYDDWIRNHWLNKDIGNRDIINAIRTIKECGCISRGNLLIGIPGLNEKQSLLILKKSIDWLLDLQIDRITVSPLNNKENTLQNFIYNHFEQTDETKNRAVIGSMEDGNPSVFFLFDAIYMLMENQKLLDIIVFAPINFIKYFDMKLKYHKFKGLKDICSYISNAMIEFDKTRDSAILERVKEQLCNDALYQAYKKENERLPGLDGVYDTLRWTGKMLSKSIWGNEWKEKTEVLDEELNHWNTKFTER